MDILRELFIDEEVELISRIPLSMGSSRDRLIWHYDKSGRYTVKNGYHVARLLNYHMHRPSSSSSTTWGHKDQFWQKLWKLKVPPKVKMHTWRLVKGILPTKSALSKRVQLPVIQTALSKRVRSPVFKPEI
ncbi:hypothetical protein ABKV19_000305 [Rosa sericea]